MNRTCVVAMLMVLGVGAGQAFGQATGPVTAGPTAEVQRLENEMWQHWRSRQFDAMSALMTPDSTFSGDAGWQTRDQLITSMQSESCSVKSVSLEMVKTTALGPDAVLIAYQTAPVGTCGGAPIPKSLGSTVWVRRAGRWLTFFHQQSPLK